MRRQNSYQTKKGMASSIWAVCQVVIWALKESMKRTQINAILTMNYKMRSELVTFTQVLSASRPAIASIKILFYLLSMNILVITLNHDLVILSF